MTLRDKLSALELAWAASGQPVTATLADGVAEVTVAHLLRPLVPSPPKDIATWFNWHDGGSVVPLPRMVPSRFDFVPLAVCLRQYQGLMEMAAAQARQLSLPADRFWRASWLPFGDDRGGGTLAVDLLSPDGVNTGGVYTVDWRDLDESQVERAASLSAMVSLWLAALPLGLWSWDPLMQCWDADHDAVPDDLTESDLVE